MHTKTFSIISLGCPKNLVDSELLVAELTNLGMQFQTELQGSSLVVLNTCGFLRPARDEARDYIRALIELKQAKEIGKIAVCGCMPQFDRISEKNRNAIQEFPDVDFWYGVPANGDWSFLRSWVECDTTAGFSGGTTRQLLTERHVAYLRIADGCDRVCSFCAIPFIRGRFQSTPLETLLEEARRLAESGVKELIVVAQETTFWGADLYGEPRLPLLLRELEKIDGFRWIRLMYTYPLFFGDDLIELFAAFQSGGKIIPYLDIPLQHINDGILKRMNRKVTRREIETLLEKLRCRIPNLVLRTSLIVGFPGETEAMFDELVKFVEQWKFERAGVFRFSAEERTAASKLSGAVPPKIIEKRYKKLYDVCERYSTNWAERQKGTVVDVQIDKQYVDESGRKEPNLFIGRTYADAPEIDPIVYITGEQLVSGSLIPCEIVEKNGCDLVAVV